MLREDDAQPSLKLHWFSPLPPARTGVADYTAALLPYLRERADVVVWTSQDRWDRGLERYAAVRRFRSGDLQWNELFADSTALNVPVYHIGNNGPIHQAIWEVGRRIPGVTVLHDTRLQHLFAHVLRDTYRDGQQYVAAMARYYGAEGRQVAECFLKGSYSTDEVAAKFPLVSLALESSLAAVVHSPESFEVVAREGHKPVIDVPFPYQARDEAPIRSAVPPFRIVICGYLGPNRRLDAFLSALGAFGRRDQFRVEVYGPIWDSPRIHQVIAEARLESLVTLKGFLPIREIDAALRGAHLAVNLRFPTMGEASMSQLQLWDHGIPSMVTPVGWYAHAPENTVLYVRPDHEQEDIHRHLAGFLDAPEKAFALGDRAREVLRTRHRPECYVDRLVSFARSTPAFRLRHTALWTAERIAADMRQWLNRASADLMSTRVSEEIAVLYAPGNPDERPSPEAQKSAPLSAAAQ